MYILLQLCCILVLTALSDVTIAQLILYFQSFGLPVNAVNSILELLDQFSQKEPQVGKCEISNQNCCSNT